MSFINGMLVPIMSYVKGFPVLSTPQNANQNGQLTTKAILVRLVKGIFLGFAFGLLFVLLAMLIGAFAGNTTNPALLVLANPLYMFVFGLMIGVGIEILPELEKA